MCIKKLMAQVKKSAANRTHEDRLSMLRDAKIIGSNGFYHKDYFSAETVEKDRNSGKPAKL
jgi:hypothetical protein